MPLLSAHIFRAETIQQLHAEDWLSDALPKQVEMHIATILVNCEDELEAILTRRGKYGSSRTPRQPREELRGIQ